MDVVSICVGMIIGGVVVLLYYTTKYSGFLRIDITDPEKNYYLIDIKKDLDTIPKKKIIVLKIDKNYVKSQ